MQALAIVLFAVAPAVAHAEVRHTLGYPGIPDRSGPLPDPTWRFELGLGCDMGNHSFLRDDQMGGGVHGEIGLRYDRIALATDYGWTWSEMERRLSWVSVRRVAIDARYSLWSRRSYERARHGNTVYGIARNDDWIEFGVGHENIFPHPTDAENRPVSRPTLSFGIGLDASHHDSGYHTGVRLAVRLLRTSGSDGVHHEAVVAMTLFFGD
jgi:hypothetical protein